jgi:hypothetical protein
MSSTDWGQAILSLEVIGGMRAGTRDSTDRDMEI